MLAGRLFWPDVSFCAQSEFCANGAGLGHDPADLAGMCGARRREFLWGRACAHQAMSLFQPTAPAIGRSDNGLAHWPQGFLGSIAHTHGAACAVVCRLGSRQGIGVDVEAIRPLGPELVGIICRPDELASHRDLEANPAASWPLLTFVSKEAVYKSLFPATRQFLEFQDVSIRFSATDPHGWGAFDVVDLSGQVDGLAGRTPGKVRGKIRGKWAVQGKFVFSGAEYVMPDPSF